MDLSPLRLSTEQLQEIRQALSARIQEGLQRPGQEIAALPAYIPPPQSTIRGDAIVVDLGGTNIRAVHVRVVGPGDVRVVAGPVQTKLRALKCASKEAFFDAQAALVDQLGCSDLPVGYVFSFPAEVRRDADAILVRWTKGIEIPGVVGARVGKGLVEAMARVGVASKNIVVLNDTVAALAGGAFCYPGAAHRVLGLIVGTGTNMAAFVSSDRSARLRDAGFSGYCAINYESGNFAPPHLSPWDAAVDARSDNPGRQRFEKAVSGHYLPQVYRELVGLDETPSSSAALDHEVTHSGPHAEQARALLDRSAHLVAAGLAAAYDQMEPGPLGVLAEGTLFWSNPRYREQVNARLTELTGRTDVQILHRDDINFVGAAISALSLAS